MPNPSTSARVRAALGPRIPALILAMATAIAHTAPASAVEPASALLHAVASTFSSEWSATLPVAVERLAADLALLGRPFPLQAQELLVRGALKQPLPQVRIFVTMWTDLAQVARMGTSARALERYSR